MAIIDADLQDPPEVILEMLDGWRKGADIAYGVRIERAGETFIKRWSAKLFYRLMARLTETSIPLDAGDFRLMDRTVVDAILAMPERDRFIRGMVAWAGFRQVPIPYSRAARFAGETKYPLKKMIKLAMDGVLSFSILPLRMASYLGLASAGLAIMGIVYALALRWLTNEWVSGWASLFIAMLFFWRDSTPRTRNNR